MSSAASSVVLPAPGLGNGEASRRVPGASGASGESYVPVHEPVSEEEVAALKAMVHDAKEELVQQSEDYAHLEEQTTELMKQVKHMEELHMDLHADYESAMASSHELEDRYASVSKETWYSGKET